tara:strand:- start:9138 stop:9935 length:798 start_codon:yes stop_codon:yes gene_type:complete
MTMPFMKEKISKKVSYLQSIPNMLSMWDFEGTNPLVAKGEYPYSLREGNGQVPIENDGVLAGHSINLSEGQYLFIPRSECKGLDLHGKEAEMTLLAWVNRRFKDFNQCETIAGMWNETNKNRQYCMFLNLGIYDSGDQVGGHISGVGGPTSGFKYCMDAAIGKEIISYDTWTFAAMTYDGREIKSYYNGELDIRNNRNPYPYPEGIYSPGKNGADFTVGAVDRSNEMGNFYSGKIGGLAVFNRALTNQEIRAIHNEYPLNKLNGE